jgi:hypothetical protein
MKTSLHPFMHAFLVLAATLSLCAVAQEHRATSLGNPRTRFAPPRRSPEDVRRLLLDEKLKPDVASVLRQAGWEGRVQDLWTAVRTAEITRIQLPVGTRMPFMASRRNGFPIALRDVLWAGDEPVEAYAFKFSSQGRAWQLIMPAPCSNFYVVPSVLPVPGLSLTLNAPAQSGFCDLLEVQAILENTGETALSGVQLSLPPPEGLHLFEEVADGAIELGDLPRGESRTVELQLVADLPGAYVLEGQASCAGEASDSAQAATRVLAPRLALECSVDGEALLNRPVEVCLTVRNEGDLPEEQATLVLPLPEGTTVQRSQPEGMAAEGAIIWQLAALAPGESRRVCAVLTAAEPKSFQIEPTVRGLCAKPVSSQCRIGVLGVPGILLEVVDVLDPVLVGDPVDYEIRVTNQGSAPITQVRLLCVFPASQKYLAGTGPTAFTAQADRVICEPLPRLEPKATVVWKLKAQVLEPGDARFRVELTGDQFSLPIEELEATTQF